MDFFHGTVFILGLLVGSFLNVVIYRLPLMEERDWITSARDMLVEYGYKVTGKNKELVGNDFNLSHPHSSCPNCSYKIRFWQNIPVVSYMLQHGKCANCARLISLRYPVVELMTAGLFILASLTWGYGFQTLAALIFIASLISLSGIDFDRQQISDSIVLPLLWIGLIANISGLFTDISSAIIGAIAGYVSLWAVYWLYLIIRKKEALGYGDFKLLAALGAWTGWQLLPLIILIAAVTGLIAGIIFMVFGKGQKIAFGPWLSLGGFVVLFWPEQANDIFQNVMGLIT